MSLHEADIAKGGTISDRLAGMIDIYSFIEAIDTNNYNLAVDNLKSVYPIIEEYATVRNVLNKESFDTFLKFSQILKNEPEFFPSDRILQDWGGSVKTLNFVAMEVV